MLPSIRAGRLPQALSKVLLALLVSYAVLIGGSWAGIYRPELRLLTLGIVAAVLAVWFLLALRDRNWHPRTSLAPAFIAAFTAFMLSEAASAQPRVGIEYLCWSVLLVGLYLLLVRLYAGTKTRRLIEWIVVCEFVLVAGLYAGDVLRQWVEWWGLVGRITTPPLRPAFGGVTYGNPSAAMTMTVLLAAPAAATLGTATKVRRLGVVSIVVVSSFITIASGSRAGWLGCALALLSTGIAALLLTDRFRDIHRPTPRVLAGILIGLCVVVAGALLFAPVIVGRALAGGEELRATYWLAALRMFQASPIVGIGPGMWVAKRISFTIAPETDYYIPHAHDLYVQTAAEFGLIGVVAGLIAVVSVIRLVLPALRDADPTRRRYAWAALFAGTYFGGHQLLDIYANLPSILLAFALPIAFLDATRRPSPVHRRPGWRSAVPLLIGAGLTVLATGTLAWAESTALTAQAAVDALNGGDALAALPAAKNAADRDPSMPPYQFILGLSSGATGDLGSAAKAFENVARTDDLPAAWIDLAEMRFELGDSQAAVEALRRGLRLGSQQPDLLLAAGDLQLRMGDESAAAASFVDAIQAIPSLAASDYWKTGIGARVWPAVRGELMSRPGNVEVALDAGLPETAMQLAEQIPDAYGRRVATLVVTAWQGDHEALAALETFSAANPLDSSLTTWVATIAVRQHRPAIAADYGRETAILEADIASPSSTTELARSWTADAPLTGADFYGQFTYRRSTPLTQFVPQLLHRIEIPVPSG